MAAGVTYPLAPIWDLSIDLCRTISPGFFGSMMPHQYGEVGERCDLYLPSGIYIIHPPKHDFAVKKPLIGCHQFYNTPTSPLGFFFLYMYTEGDEQRMREISIQANQGWLWNQWSSFRYSQVADYEEGVKSRSLELEAVAMVAIGPTLALAFKQFPETWKNRNQSNHSGQYTHEFGNYIERERASKFVRSSGPCFRYSYNHEFCNISYTDMLIYCRHISCCFEVCRRLGFQCDIHLLVGVV